MQTRLLLRLLLRHAPDADEGARIAAIFDTFALVLRTAERVSGVRVDMWEEKQPGATYAVRLWASAKKLELLESTLESTLEPGKVVRTLSCRGEGFDITVFAEVK